MRYIMEGKLFSSPEKVYKMYNMLLIFRFCITSCIFSQCRKLMETTHTPLQAYLRRCSCNRFVHTILPILPTWKNDRCAATACRFKLKCNFSTHHCSMYSTLKQPSRGTNTSECFKNCIWVNKGCDCTAQHNRAFLPCSYLPLNDDLFTIHLNQDKYTLFLFF